MALFLIFLGYLVILAALVAANCYVDRLLTPHGRRWRAARDAVREAENVFIVSDERLWRLIARGEDVLKNLQQTK